MLSFSGVIDLLSILPFYLRSFFPYLDLRILRTLRLLRILKLSHYNSAMEDLFEAIFEERKSFFAASYLFVIVFIVSSSLIYFAEHRHHPSGFQSIPDSMYWALITLTTVGYGDITPITAAGKTIAVISAILGVFVVALMTGIVATAFNAQMERRNLIFEEHVRNALLDGFLDSTEKADLEVLRKKFGIDASTAKNSERNSNVKAAKAPLVTTTDSALVISANLSPTLSCNSSSIQNLCEACLMASTVAGRISDAVIAVYVPAALINVRTPNSANKSRFIATANGVAIGAALAVEKPPTIDAPASGVMEIYFNRSLRFIIFNLNF